MVKKYLKLINNERKANDIMPIKACSGLGTYDSACTKGWDAGQCWGVYVTDTCQGNALNKDFTTCSGAFTTDGSY